jgi:hypothetical protein
MFGIDDDVLFGWVFPIVFVPLYVGLKWRALLRYARRRCPEIHRGRLLAVSNALGLGSIAAFSEISASFGIMQWGQVLPVIAGFVYGMVSLLIGFLIVVGRRPVPEEDEQSELAELIF